MKTKLFLFATSFLLLACSNDDNNGSEDPQEFKIKKFTSVGVDANGAPTGDRSEYLDYWKPFFSNNNFTSEVYIDTQFPQDNYTLLRTFQYNENGYPISAIVKKDGVLFEELSYEYY